MRGTSKQRKCWGTWNPGKQIFDFWGTSKFISLSQQPPPPPPPPREGLDSKWIIQPTYRHNHMVPSDIGWARGWAVEWSMHALIQIFLSGGGGGGGGSKPSGEKTALIFLCLFWGFLVQISSGMRGVQLFMRGGGVQMLISIEFDRTCDLPGMGVRTPYPHPPPPHPLWIGTCMTFKD